MANVLLVAYLLIVLALIVVILLQRSEGGALGIGGGGGGGGFMTARGSANLLTRTTAILAVLFFATAIGLTVLSELDRGTSSILDRAADGSGGSSGTVLDALDALQGDSQGDLPVPATSDEAPGGEAPSAGDDLNLSVPETPASDDTTGTAPAAPEAPAIETPAEQTDAEPTAPVGADESVDASEETQPAVPTAPGGN